MFEAQALRSCLGLVCRVLQCPHMPGDLGLQAGEVRLVRRRVATDLRLQRTDFCLAGTLTAADLGANFGKLPSPKHRPAKRRISDA